MSRIKYAIYYFYGDDIIMRDYSHAKRTKDEIKTIIHRNHKVVYDKICEGSHLSKTEWRKYIQKKIINKSIQTHDFETDIHNMFDYVMILKKKKLAEINNISYCNYRKFLEDSYTIDEDLTDYSEIIRKDFIEKILSQLEYSPPSLLQLCIDAVPQSHKTLLKTSPYMPRKKFK